MSAPERFSVVVKPIPPPIAAATATPKPTTTTEVSTTMQVENAKLARRLGLPANAHESMIRARLAGVEAENQVRALSRAQPVTARLDPGTLSVLGAPELRQLAQSLSTGADKDAVAAELAHREYFSRNFPPAARTMGYTPARVDLSARSGDVRIGISG